MCRKWWNILIFFFTLLFSFLEPYSALRYFSSLTVLCICNYIICPVGGGKHLPASSCYVINPPTMNYDCPKAKEPFFQNKSTTAFRVQTFSPPPHVRRNKIPQLRRKQPSFSPEVAVGETSGQDGSPQREAGVAVPRPVRSLYLDPVRLLELLQHVDAVRGASGLQEVSLAPLLTG